jgi:hypothetical protein
LFDDHLSLLHGKAGRWDRHRRLTDLSACPAVRFMCVSLTVAGRLHHTFYALKALEDTWPE